MDRFHVVRWFSEGSPRCAATCQRRPDGTLPAFDPDVFRARFALLRRGDQLTDTQAAHIRRVLADHGPGYRSPGTPSKSSTASTSPKTTTAPSPRFAGSADLYATGQLPEFRKVVDTVIAWGDEILAWHHVRTTIQRPTRRSLLSTSSKSSRRVAHGFTNPRIITQPEDSS